jgi:hypothetical protein
VVQVHLASGHERRTTLEAAAVEPAKDVSREISACLILIAKLRTTAVKVLQEQLEVSASSCILLHLAGRALRIVSGIHLELLAEPALQLKAVVEQDDLLGISIDNLAERCIAARKAVLMTRPSPPPRGLGSISGK